jgi:hypothetical protein
MIYDECSLTILFNKKKKKIYEMKNKVFNALKKIFLFESRHITASFNYVTRFMNDSSDDRYDRYLKKYCTYE